MKKVFAILALTASLTACTRMEQPVNETPEGTETAAQTYTLSVKATKGLDTRALELNGDTLNAIWDGSECVYVFRNGGSNRIAILTPDQHTHADPASCQLVGTFFERPQPGDVLTLKLNDNTYTGQGGTLAFIGEHSDYAVATLTVTGIVDGEIQSEEGGAKFVSQQAIVKFTLKDKAGTAISPTTFTVMNRWNVAATVTPITNTYSTNGAGVLYVAVPAVSNGTVNLIATDGTNTCTYTKSGVTFKAGQYYSITVKMGGIINLGLAPFYHENGIFTAQDGHILTGTFPNGGKRVRIAPGATVTLDGVTIENSAHDGITLEGSATILLKNWNTVGGGSNHAGISVPEGSALILRGDGRLTVSGAGNAAGIGSGAEGSSGAITISGGTITANGGERAAGIGSGYLGSCSDITIEGGTITANGGERAAGIGSGYLGSCGAITIISPAQVQAKKGEEAGYSIGPGYNGRCGTVKINGTLWGEWENDAFRVINPDLSNSPLRINWPQTL